MDNRSISDWEVALTTISDSSDPDGPLAKIKECFHTQNCQDPFDQIDKQLNCWLDELRSAFERLSK